MWGLLAALHRTWTCDDAYISFRYARNFLRGLGLVFNPGERVEGYTNLSWTLWTALGMKLGFAPETWAAAWGIACYGAALGLLAWMGRGLSGAKRWIPAAALLGAALPEWNIFATSGLETSALTLLLVLGTAFLVVRHGRTSRAIAGVCFALAALTRPDAAMFAAAAAAWLAWNGEAPGARTNRVCSTRAFIVCFLAVWLPVFLWRWHYYGDLFPNTYYAKSAFRPWWSQGWFYLKLCFRKEWVLPVGAAIGLVGLAMEFMRRRAAGAAAPEVPVETRRAAALALVVPCALGYTLLVVRAGGDFMFMRLLIPAVPFYLLSLEWGMASLLRSAESALAFTGAAVVTGLFIVATLLAPSPFKEVQMLGGVADEWSYYQGAEGAKLRQRGDELRPYFEGLPVTVVFAGGEAEMVYYADPRVAIEAATGLTDRFIAHQALAARGRVGHEKVAPLTYLVEKRHVDMTLSHATAKLLKVEDSLGVCMIGMGERRVYMLHWNHSLASALVQRGAQVANFPALVDMYVRNVSAQPDSDFVIEFPMLQRFYFNFNADSAHLQPLLERAAAIAARK